MICIKDSVTKRLCVLDVGISPGFLASSGIGDNSHELMNGDERYEKEKRVYPKGKKKRRAGRNIAFRGQALGFYVSNSTMKRKDRSSNRVNNR